MALETISREEFDRRLDAANVQRTHELQAMEQQQAEAEKLLSYYERVLEEIEAELGQAPEGEPLPVSLRRRLQELAERTARVAASV